MFESTKAKLLGAGAGLMLIGSAAGGAALLGITSTAAQTPTNTPVVTQNAPANQTPDTAETTNAPEGAKAETTEANEPQLPGGGHADADGVDVQHDFQGVE
ncbi:MAG: hypothetical protein KGK07_02490 [Chloroflexota bacterium]|nr:hypothetical protein [Chloroflexota bacterium]